MKDREEILSHHPAQSLRPFTVRPNLPLKLAFSVHRMRDRLDFRFTLSGRVAAELEKLVLPEPVAGPERQRRDELWKATCLEIFVGPADRQSYFELNLSPTGHWNVYVFDGYRSGMRPAVDVQAPFASCERMPEGDTISWLGRLQATSGASDLRALFGSAGLVLNATAVLEYKSGEREYWALAHAGQAPDFHLREGFRLPL